MRGIVRMARLICLFLAVALALAAPEAIAKTSTNSELKTPGGLPYRHIVVRGDPQHTISIAFRDDWSVRQPERRSAAYAFAGSMILLGTKAIKQGDLYEDLNDLRTRFSVSASSRQASIQLAGPPAKLAAAADLAGKVLAAPALPEARLVRNIKSARVGYAQGRDRADTIASQLLTHLIVDDRRRVDLASLKPDLYADVTPDDIRAWRDAVMTRDRAVIVSAGPMSASDAAAVIDKLMAGLPAKGAAVPKTTTPLRNPGKVVLLVKPGIAQTSIAAGGPTEWKSSPDLTAGNLAARVLGGDFTSRLNAIVRGKLGATYGIRAGLTGFDHGAYGLVISSAVDNAKAAAALDAVRETYRTFLANGITTAELDAQRAKMIQEVKDRTTKAQPTAQQAQSLLMAGLPLELMATQEKRLKALTADEVNRLAKERMAKLPLTVVVVAPTADAITADCVIKSPDEIDTCLDNKAE